MTWMTNYARLICVLLLTQGWVSAQIQTTQPFPNVTYAHEIRTDPAMHLHVVKVDLTAVGVSLHVARGGMAEVRYTTVLQRVTTIAPREGLDIAIDRNFFRARDSYETFG